MINLTMFAQVIVFSIFVWVCMKTVWPAIINALEERKRKIEAGLEAADRAGRDLELAQNRAAERMKEAKLEAAAIIEQANKRANQIVEEAKEQAVAEGSRLKAAAQAEIDQQMNRAKEELRAKVATLAVQGAEKILETRIDENINREMLDKLAAQL